MRVYIFGLLTLWQLSGLPALAATSNAGVIEDQVSFQVDAEREVENDRAVATLSATAEDRDPARLAQNINDVMSWALEQLHDQKSITSRSGSYRTYPVYDDRKIVRWRATQELQLESGDIERMARIIGVLQERLQVQAMEFLVSASERREVEASLTKEALVAFQQRAEVIRNALGASGYRLMDINVNTGGLRPQPFMRADVMGASRAGVAGPAVEQGTSTVTVQVSGRIRLLRE